MRGLTLIRVLNIGLLIIIIIMLLLAIWAWNVQWLLTAGVFSLIWWGLDNIGMDPYRAQLKQLQAENDAYQRQLFESLVTVDGNHQRPHQTQPGEPYGQDRRAAH